MKEDISSVLGGLVWVCLGDPHDCHSLPTRAFLIIISQPLASGIRTPAALTKLDSSASGAARKGIM